VSTGGSRRRRPLFLAVALAPLLGGTLLVRHLNQGWGPARPRPWRAATGWDRLPALPEPTAQIPLGPGAEPLALHWLGHAGFLLEWHGTRLLLDPNLSSRCTVSPRLMESPPGLPEGAASLPPVAAALVSHAHYDHLDLPTLEGVASLPVVVLPAGSEAYAEPLRGRGIRVVGVEEDEAVAVGALEIRAVPARHHGSRRHPLASHHRALGYVIRAAGTAVYFAGDTGYGPHFLAIGRRFRPAVAILPIGAYAPAFPIGRVHLSPEQAVRAARDLGEGAGLPPPLVVPCHFGTFVLSLDRPDEALPRFARAADHGGLRWIMPALLGLDAGTGEGALDGRTEGSR